MQRPEVELGQRAAGFARPHEMFLERLSHPAEALDQNLVVAEAGQPGQSQPTRVEVGEGLLEQAW